MANYPITQHEYRYKIIGGYFVDWISCDANNTIDNGGGTFTIIGIPDADISIGYFQVRVKKTDMHEAGQILSNDIPFLEQEINFPSDITGLIADFDFSDASSITVESGKITQIEDKVSGLLSLQPDINRRPVFNNVGGSNNKPYASFTSGARLSGSILSSSLNFSIFIVRKVYENDDDFYGGVFSNGNDNAYAIIDYQGNKSGGFYPNVTGLASQRAFTFPNKWEVIATSHSSGSNKQYNTLGMNLGVVRTNAPADPISNGHFIGYVSFGGVNTMEGEIERILMYNRQVTDVEADKIIRFLKSYYKLDLPANVSFGGDSITSNLYANPSYPDQSIIKLISQKYYSSVNNTAVSGRNTQDIIDNIQTEVLDLYNPANKNLYLLMIGHNDRITSTETFNNIKDICLTCKEVGYKVVILTILYSSNNTDNARIDIINNLIRNNYLDFADGMVDTNQIPELINPNNTMYYPDGVHLNTLGATIVSNQITPKIVEWLNLN